eukprot:TRINITY_DN3041_c0_g2_i7.p1 TRINITY_DN3041_c0_g2~~TRINITY_DN3041_c0_g2_i7.p1  ORF type:complete len:257 (-),score=26.57 TRINITY_DN3041_c0_g2_i7:359-1129(-)
MSCRSCSCLFALYFRGLSNISQQRNRNDLNRLDLLTELGSSSLVTIQKSNASMRQSRKQEIFDSVPLDVIRYLFSFLEPRDLGRLSIVNRELYFLSGDETLWRYLTKKSTTTRYNYGLSGKEREYERMQNEKNQKIKFFWKSYYVSQFCSNAGMKWKPERKKESFSKETLMNHFLGPNKARSQINLVVLGSNGVGKSATVIQFVQSVFCEEYDPTIEDSYQKKKVILDTPILFDVADTVDPGDYYGLRDQCEPFNN